jgi:acetyl esterase/lipase
MLSGIAIVALLITLGVSADDSPAAGDGDRATVTTAPAVVEAAPGSTAPPVTEPGAPAEPAEPAEPVGVTVAADVVYRVVDGEALGADVYVPATGTANGVTVVLVHGGGWVGGDKRDFAPEAEALAQSGYVAVTVNYRLAPQHRYPAPLEDVRAALDWLALPDTVARFGVDPTRIGMLGASAGGHLATLLGLTDPRVGAVVSWSGVYDLTTFTMDDRLLGCAPSTCVDIARAASPIAYVAPGHAPMLLVAFTDDPIVPVADTRAFEAALQLVGAEHQTLVVNGTGHAGTVRDQALEATATYLAGHLAP